MPRRKISLSAPAESTAIDLNTGKPVEKASLPLICGQIKVYRELRAIEQKAFAARLGVSANAVSNWECGRSRPDVNLLPAICQALGISLYDLYAVEKPEGLLSSREKKLVEGYRMLSPGNQYAVDRMLEALRFVQDAEGRPELHRLLYFERSLAAGAADPTEFEQEAQPFYLYDSPETRRADYVFRVNGDSMEPDYHTGDLVLVEKSGGAAALHTGEIGAFIVGNETYIKRYEADGLHSLNPKYPVLRFDEEESVYLIGRVLGTVSGTDIPTREEAEAWLTVHGGSRV